MMSTPDFLMRPNPITQKYYTLTRDVDDSIAKDLRPDKDESQQISVVINLPDF